MSEAWRASYDAWLTTPPDDGCYCDGEPCDECGAPCKCCCECGDIDDMDDRDDDAA